MHSIRNLIAAAILLSATAEGVAVAQDWKADWDKAVAGAKKEGALVIGVPSSAEHRNFLQTEWSKAFPDIKISMTTVAGGRWFQRVKIERESGKNLWDLALTGVVVCYQMKDAGFADPIRDEFILPDIKDPKTWGGWESALFDRESKYVLATRSFLKMPFYNARLLAPEKAKALGKGVFLAPELKGKIVWHDPLIPGSGESFPPVMRRVLGDQGLKTFVQEQVVFTATGPDVVEKMARGAFAIGLGPVMTSRIEHEYRQAGVDIDIRPLGNTPEFAAYGNTGGSNMIVVKDRPNPNATRVFVNWFLSKEVQTALARAIGEDSRRTDVPSFVKATEKRVPGVAYFESQREEFKQEFQDSHAMIRQLRRK